MRNANRSLATPWGWEEVDLMSTATPAAKTAPAVLYGIDWQTYSRLLRAFNGRRRFHLTYGRGTLEIMSPLWVHEEPAGQKGDACQIIQII
jgi:hypothetical protein